MPNTPLCLCFTYNAEPFLHLRVDQIDHFDSNELCHAANWIIQQLRSVALLSKEIDTAYCDLSSLPKLFTIKIEGAFFGVCDLFPVF